VHTPGGVIAAGKSLMDIVPTSGRLIIEASIDPIDIDVVKPGLDAIVYLTPYNRRSMIPLKGHVLSISADQLVEQRTGASYYLGRIEIRDDVTKVAAGAKLYPGMPVEVMIVTGKRSLFVMLAQPIIRSLNRAFRED
jgi:HlyD family type I secretion membrane fusion protein